jgi:beta-galactosidase
VVPLADNLINFKLAGPGKIIGVGNGDPGSHEADKATSRKLFNGLAQVIVQASRQPGTIRFEASSPELRKSEVIINGEPCESQPSVPAAE